MKNTKTKNKEQKTNMNIFQYICFLYDMGIGKEEREYLLKKYEVC